MDLQKQDYDPSAFIDWLLHDVFKAKNDAGLARALEVSPVTISRIRARLVPVPAHVLISVHEETGLRTTEIKARLFRQAETA